MAHVLGQACWPPGSRATPANPSARGLSLSVDQELGAVVRLLAGPFRFCLERRTLPITFSLHSPMREREANTYAHRHAHNTRTQHISTHNTHMHTYTHTPHHTHTHHGGPDLICFFIFKKFLKIVVLNVFLGVTLKTTLKITIIK